HLAGRLPLPEPGAGRVRRHRPGGPLPGQRLRPAGHGRQRLGVDRRLVPGPRRRPQRLLRPGEPPGRRPRPEPRPARRRRHPAKGDEGRVAPVCPQLLPPLPPGRPYGPPGRHRHLPPGLPRRGAPRDARGLTGSRAEQSQNGRSSRPGAFRHLSHLSRRLRGRTWADLPLRAKGLVVAAIPLLALLPAAVLFGVALAGDRGAEDAVVHTVEVERQIANVQAMQDSEQRLLSDRQAQARRARPPALGASGVGVLLGIAGGIAAVLLFTSGVTRRAARLEALLEHIVAWSPMVMFRGLLGGQGERYISGNVERLLGYTPEQVLGTPGFWVEQLHPEDRDRFTAGSSGPSPSGARTGGRGAGSCPPAP